MTTEMSRMEVADLSVTVVRKNIKNLHLGVYPPEGGVRVAVPLAMRDDAVRLAIIGRLGWIRRQREKFVKQSRLAPSEYVSGESHYYFGRRYRLRVIDANGPASITRRGNSRIEMRVPPGTDAGCRGRVLADWYRKRLREWLPSAIAQWEERLGVKAAGWGIKRMRTKWGSCNPATARIWFNLELAKKPEASIEYVVVHELAHLRVRHHDDRFIALLDEYLPNWRAIRQSLSAQPLAHEQFMGQLAPS